MGLLTPISGPNPDWGKKQTVGMEMGVDEINHRGGIAGVPIEAVVDDSSGDPEVVVPAYRKMAREGALVVIGPLFTNECECLFPVTNEVKTAAPDDHRSARQRCRLQRQEGPDGG